MDSLSYTHTHIELFIVGLVIFSLLKQSTIIEVFIQDILLLVHGVSIIMAVLGTRELTQVVIDTCSSSPDIDQQTASKRESRRGLLLVFYTQPGRQQTVADEESD